MIRLDQLQVVIGVLLLIFGLQWMRKAIERASGRRALHDEEKIFAREVAGIGRLLGERYGVAIGRGGVEFEPAATAPRGIKQLLQQEFGARFAFVVDQRLQRFQPFGGFYRVGVGGEVHGAGGGMG